MEQFKKTLKKIIPDELSGFIILGFVTIAIVATIGVYALTKYSSVAVDSKLGEAEELQQNDVGSIENLTSVENINNINDLQKLNEKELEDAKKKENKEENKNTSSAQYYIKVNYGAQVVTIYTKDSKGKYTVPVKAMVCSTGTHTPKGGVYKAPAKIRWCHMLGDVYAQYCTQIVGDILFHSVPYLTNGDHSSLEYWAYDKLGTKASLGCIRLTCKDAKWIYDNCKIGTQVEFYSSSNPGPLGKPSARKISNAPSYLRGWDPTDPVSNNPWKKYLANGGGETEKPIPNPKPENNKIENEINDVQTNEMVNDTEVNETVVNETTNIVVNDIEDENVNKTDTDVNEINN